MASEDRTIPDGHAPYRRTSEFGQDTIPAALQRDHTTKPGVWALIHVQGYSNDTLALVAAGAVLLSSLVASIYAIIDEI